MTLKKESGLGKLGEIKRCSEKLMGIEMIDLDLDLDLDCQGIKWSQEGVMGFKLIERGKTGRNDGGIRRTGAHVNLGEF